MRLCGVTVLVVAVLSSHIIVAILWQILGFTANDMATDVALIPALAGMYFPNHSSKAGFIAYSIIVFQHGDRVHTEIDTPEKYPPNGQTRTLSPLGILLRLIYSCTHLEILILSTLLCFPCWLFKNPFRSCSVLVLALFSLFRT